LKLNKQIGLSILGSIVENEYKDIVSIYILNILLSFHILNRNPLKPWETIGWTNGRFLHSITTKRKP